MKCKLLRPLRQAKPARGTFPAGHVIDHPQAYVLCQMGHAIPVDDECRVATNRTAEQLASAQRAADKVSRGIHPDDYEAFDAGTMVGYYPDGTKIPGPNYVDEEPEIEEEPEDE